MRGILMNATASGTKWSHVFSIIGFKCANRKYGVSKCMRLQTSKRERKTTTHRLFGGVDFTTTQQQQKQQQTRVTKTNRNNFNNNFILFF